MKTNRSSVAIVACVHGDEIAGKLVIRELNKNSFIRGRVGFFVAHPKAVARKKRFFTQDLNRSFPGRLHGLLEERLAYVLREKLNAYDIVLDLHATNSNIHRLAIVTGLSTRVRRVLCAIPIQKVALMPKRVFGGKELVRYHRAGVSLEYGPDKSGKNYRTILKDVYVILRNLGVIPGPRKCFPKKDLYRVFETYEVGKDITPVPSLRDFHLIKKGQIIGRHKNGTTVASRATFYPLFVGKGRYPKTLALMSFKKKLVL
ncbi:MAG: succinylglutamate desuccinylase/aspartoacylase family protein [Candidatus Jorgensenbacteria bacterium]|nr:succinylglutamate desuccinylase/aspartoacylase family protein [Candidatus Jorgensenbacteria bacterium]